MKPSDLWELGSLYPALNLVAKPFVCPHSQMSYAQNVSQIGYLLDWQMVLCR